MVTVNYTQDITFLLFPEGRSAFSAHLILINLRRDRFTLTALTLDTGAGEPECLEIMQ